MLHSDLQEQILTSCSQHLDVQELELIESQAPNLGSHFALFLTSCLYASFTLMTGVLKTHVDVRGMCIRKRRVLWKGRVACPS